MDYSCSRIFGIGVILCPALYNIAIYFFALGLLICLLFLFGINRSIDIQMHSTYIVLASKHIGYTLSSFAWFNGILFLLFRQDVIALNVASKYAMAILTLLAIIALGFIIAPQPIDQFWIQLVIMLNGVSWF